MGWYKKKAGQKISAILPELVKSKGWEARLDLYSIFPKWRKLVGEDIAGCTRPWKIDKNVLWIEVENSAWMQQLQFEKLAILERLNAALRITSIRDIRMVLPKPQEDRFPDREPELPKVRFVSPPQEKVKAFEQRVEGIRDDECRQALFRFWYLCQACKQDKEKK